MADTTVWLLPESLKWDIISTDHIFYSLCLIVHLEIKMYYSLCLRYLVTEQWVHYETSSLLTWLVMIFSVSVSVSERVHYYLGRIALWRSSWWNISSGVSIFFCFGIFLVSWKRFGWLAWSFYIWGGCQCFNPFQVGHTVQSDWQWRDGTHSRQHSEPWSSFLSLLRQ